MKNLYFFFLIALLGCGSSSEHSKTYDIVLQNGRLIDPATNTNDLFNIGINGESIAAISKESLQGKKIIDATELVIAPGFIDLHTHTPTALGTHFQLKDGVTTALELEAGAFPIPEYGGLIKEEAINNYGASVGYFSIRTQVIEDRKVIAFVSENGPAKPGLAFIQPATEEEIESIRALLNKGIDEGGIGIGLPIDYMTKAISDEELNMIFEVAAERSAPIWVHLRRGVQGDTAGLEEFIALSKEYKVAIHICHINANAMGKIQEWIARIEAANEEGADITTEMYPYPAGSAPIASDVFTRDWQNIFGITYEDVQWSSTGEFLTKETFENYQKNEPTGMVIHHYGKEEWLQIALQSSAVMIGTDAMPLYRLSSKVTPRGIGTYSKILGKYVRDLKLISLEEAIAKMSYLPAKRLEKTAPIFEKKGRIEVGADADIVLFNPKTIKDNATYENPFVASTGMKHVFVGGVQVLEDGEFVKDTYPGGHVLGGE